MDRRRNHHSYYDAWALRGVAAALAEAAGASRAAAYDLAEGLVEAELRGIDTHGLHRLEPYVDRIRSGSVAGQVMPVIEGSGGVLLIDGCNGIGHHVAAVTTDAVSEAARQRGVATAAVRNSNHFGFAGLFASRIASRGMVGVVISNGTPCVAAPGGKAPFFSNNPLAIAAPMGDGTYFELDMATSVTSRDNLRSAAARGEAIPDGWASGPDGQETNDALEALAGSMRPIGDGRGFALIAGFEVLAGVLSGAAVADEVPSKHNSDRPENVGHFMLALSLDFFNGETQFLERIARMQMRMRAVPLIDDAPVPRLPGERRWQLRAQRLLHGIPLTEKLEDQLQGLASQAGVKFPELLQRNEV